jgi:potassium-transporting ATPase potassium-binding subunit
MNTELAGIIVTFAFTTIVAIPFGKYIARIFSGDKTRSDVLFAPLERLFLRLSGIDSAENMGWKQHLTALLTINFVWFLMGMAMLMNQDWLPLNPDGNPAQTADLAFNTSISFVVNCNLQHYSGETGLSYLSQLFLVFLHFVTAGTGIAAAAVMITALKERSLGQLGNFYNLMLKSCTRILLPLALIIAILLVINGTPMTFDGKDTVVTLQGDTVQVSTGPVAAFAAIKHVGTNGGGYYGANSAHPLENPNYFTNMIEMFGQMIIPMAIVFAFGYLLMRKKMSFMIFGVMTLGFLMLTFPVIFWENQGNPAIQAMGIDNSLGALEGKEIRLGTAASAFWSIATTVISAGSVNAMHDSFMPLSGMNQMLAMMTNAFYGGVGVGMLNFFIFIVLAVFISGLMVGRTPELLGRKIEGREMKIAMMVALVHPLLILTGAALAVVFPGTINTLNNPGFHGFSEVLYEYTSSAANNGSGFEGLGDNSLWWNISTGFVLILSRYIPIIGPVAIAGLMASKPSIPEGAGTLRTDSGTFGVMIMAVIVIITALSFFPALTLGPIAEYFSMR